MSDANSSSLSRKLRIAVLGSSNVGKSAITVRYLTKRFITEYQKHTGGGELLLYGTTTVRFTLMTFCCCTQKFFTASELNWIRQRHGIWRSWIPQTV